MTDPSYGPANGSVLALDIGGTKLAAGLVKPDTGTITQFGTIPTPRGQAPTGNAGNIGHAIADPDGEPCPCGGVGCVETIASGPSMVRRARAAGWPGPPDATASDLAAAAACADPPATAAIAAAAHAQAIAIVSAAVLADLDVVVIGGGVAAFGDLLLAPLTKECMHYGRNAFARRLKVRLASLSGPEAGLIGAAALAATSGNQYSVSGLM